MMSSMDAPNGNVSQSAHAWANWARRQMASRSETSAQVMAHGLADDLHSWELREIARRQVAESRADRIAFECS